MAKDSQNPYIALKANDPGSELVQLVIDYYRSHRSQFSSAEATNIGAIITSILNGTYRV